MKHSFLDWIIGGETWWRGQARVFLFVIIPFVLLIALFLSVDSCAGSEA